MLSKIALMAKLTGVKGPVGIKLLTAAYHENVIDHYENPRNVGSLDKNKKNYETASLFGTILPTSSRIISSTPSSISSSFSA